MSDRCTEIVSYFWIGFRGVSEMPPQCPNMGWLTMKLLVDSCWLFIFAIVCFKPGPNVGLASKSIMPAGRFWSTACQSLNIKVLTLIPFSARRLKESTICSSDCLLLEPINVSLTLERCGESYCRSIHSSNGQPSGCWPSYWE